MASEAPVKFIKKRKGPPSGLRKKETNESPAAAAAAAPGTSEVVIAPKKQATSHLIQGTGNKRRKTNDASADGLALSDSDDDDQQRASYAVRHSAASRRERRRSSSPPAWVSSEAIKANARDKNAPPPDAAHDDDGLYRGAQGEKHKVPKAFGPIKGGPANVRTITLTDYQPDVCKDYKETGFCGFGDTCKFLHDRGDYLHGWQLDNSFLSNSAASGSFMAKQAARDGETAAGGGGSDDDEAEDVPFACLICRKPFGPDPVVTTCGHYFDSACAIKRFAKTGKCFACGASTNGVFNRATKLIQKTKEREALNARAREEEEGEAGNDDEGGIEIEGLETKEDEPEAPSRRRARSVAEEESEGEYEEEEEQPKRRRPVIEYQ
ncbi:hypothetical protein JCM11491_005458 [Sporobolomyces phaffii]